jgi:hypothetical protein
MTTETTPAIPRRRPRRADLVPGVALGGTAGAALGGALSDRENEAALNMLLGAALGGLFGGMLAASMQEQLSLRQSLKSELARRGLHLISLRRFGPYKASMAYRTSDGHVWLIESQADSSHAWKQDDLEDWLYADMLGAVEKKGESR